MIEAFATAMVFYVLSFLDTFIGTQALTRPIVLASVMGLVAGDLKTGVIMGAELEALYMGVSAIGGVKPSDYKSASVISAALVIYTGIDIETGLALAAAIGAVLNTLNPISKAINNLMQPLYNKIAKEGNQKKFYGVMVMQTVLLLNTLNTLAIFFCMLLGSEAVNLFVSVVPQWIISGLNVSANVLVIVGLGLITQAIWGPTTIVFVLLGFILSKYLGLSALIVAVLGVIIAYLMFRRSNEMNEIKLSMQTGNSSINDEGDDFYA